MPFLKNRTKRGRSIVLENLTKKNGTRHTVFNIIGDKYRGDWKEDLKEGKGTLLTVNRQLYEGDFERGYRHGFGLLAVESEDKSFKLEYRGEWRKGRRQGRGIRRYADGSLYNGNWKNGKRDGYGLMWYPNGDFYAGDFKNDKRHGLGMLAKSNTNRYEGAWDNDVKHGKGRYLHLTTGQMQEGVWVNDRCVFCTFRDIRYRQSARHPTKYPINKNEFLGFDEMCKEQEAKVLEQRLSSCLSLTETTSSENEFADFR